VQPSDRENTYDSISSAFLLLLERLTPLERAVFVLKEVFDYTYAEIAQILDRTESACRKLGTRAKKHVTEGRPRFTISMAQYQQVIDNFIDACETGNLEALVEVLAQEAIIYSDGGGKATAGTKPVSGAEIVARFILGGMRVIADQNYTWEVVELNGRPAIVVRIAGKAFGVVQFELSDYNHIAEIHFITNPDKIRHL
jgi:RNA polymerase sigma-70 factor (ECF subfamily)